MREGGLVSLLGMCVIASPTLHHCPTTQASIAVLGNRAMQLQLLESFSILHLGSRYRCDSLVLNDHGLDTLYSSSQHIDRDSEPHHLGSVIDLTQFFVGAFYASSEKCS